MLISSFICAIMDKNQGVMFQTLKFFTHCSLIWSYQWVDDHSVQTFKLINFLGAEIRAAIEIINLRNGWPVLLRIPRYVIHVSWCWQVPKHEHHLTSQFMLPLTVRPAINIVVQVCSLPEFLRWQIHTHHLYFMCEKICYKCLCSSERFPSYRSAKVQFRYWS